MSHKTVQSRCIVDRGGKAHGAAVGLRATIKTHEALETHKTHGGAVGFASAYTLIEVLVVAVIVVLMLGMALPVFRVITGSRSEAGASNIIASMLGRARTDAIGLQKPIGVAFVYNPSSQQSYMAEVEFPDCPAWVNTLTYVPGNYVAYSPGAGQAPYYYCTTAPPVGTAPTNTAYWQQVGGPPLDIRANTELAPLPAGIGVQTICNSQFSAGVRTTDGYLGFGVILFDGFGRLTGQNYGVSAASKLSTSAGLNASFPTANLGIANPFGSTFYGVGSQFGLVVFQNEAFVAQSFPTADPAYTTVTGSQASAYTSGTPSQQTEENWLDQNATPLLIDRYTGTLIKAE